ncbi:MAG: DUF4236 domain-containing protein [Chloroflexi bacterium]|nr:DUF4236 domain-containing protein [Chloroflexota bacterium]
MSSEFQFRRRIKILPGVVANLSKSGISLSIGPRGLTYNIGPRGQFLTLGIPGTGLYRRQKIGGRARGGEAEPAKTEPVLELSAWEGRPPKEARQFQRGAEAYFAEDYAGALAIFTEPVGAYYPDMRLMAGLSAYFLEQPEAAIEHLIASLDGSPQPGTEESLTGQLINPAVTFTVPVTRFSDGMLPYSQMLAVFLVIELIQLYGEMDNAVEIARQFLDHLEGDSKRLLQLSLAEVLFSMERYDELEALFENEIGALENEDNIAVELMLYWGETLTMKERYDAAKDVFIRAHRRSKDRDPVLLNLVQYARADMFERWGKRADARRYFEKLYSADPSFANVEARLKALEEENSVEG